MADNVIISPELETLTLGEVAQVFKCSQRTVRRAIENGRLRNVGLGDIRIARSQVQAIINGEATPARSHLKAYHENRQVRRRR